jgi:hypothetical protein
MNLFADISPVQKSNTPNQYKFILPDYNLNHHRWISDWAMTSEDGKPQLPQTGFFFQCNESATVSIKIIDIHETRCHVNDISPSPVISRAQFVYSKDRQTYETDQFYPSRIFQIDPPSKWAGTNVVRILIRPFQWNPVTKQLKIIHQMTFSVIQTKQDSVHIKRSSTKKQFDPIKARLIINYLPQKNISPHRQKTSVNYPGLNLYVTKNMIYRLTYSDLVDHQFPTSQKPASFLQLWHNNKQIPLHINTNTSYLQKDDTILFYGQKIDSHFTNINVYQLFWGDLPGTRMSIRDASPNQKTFASYAWHTVTFEKNTSDNFWPATPGAPEVDFVFWDMLDAPDTFSTTFDLPELMSSNMPSQLSIFFQEKTNSYHKIQILVNGHQVFQDQFHSDSLFQVDISLDTDMLKPQNNSLAIASELSSGIWADKLYINKFIFHYPKDLIARENMAIIETSFFGQNIDISGFTSTPIQVFDISDPDLPFVLTTSVITHFDSNYHIQFFNKTSSKMFVCTDENMIRPEIQSVSDEQLQSTENMANYLIITPKQFIPAVQPLLNHYKDQGIISKVVSPDAIYDIFNGGIIDPHAIQKFLAYSYAYWKISPDYVLLIGDGNLDYLDYFQTGKQNEAPVYLTYIDDVGLTANDHFYVCIDGDDLYPEMSIGRLPGKTISDVEKLILKRLNYSKAINTTRQRNLFISDNDKDNIFEKLCQNSLDYLSDKMEQVHLSLTDSSYLNQLTRQMFNYLNDGVLIATYMGHGSIDNWAGEPILHADDIQRIGPNTPLTFYISLNCLSGYFALPDRYSLSQKLILPENKGAIAVFAPTGFAQVWEIDILSQAIFSMIRSNPELPVGDLVRAAKIESYKKGIRASTVKMFTLTGDPLLRLKIPQHLSPGDIDSDGFLTLRDLLLMLKYLGNIKK